MLSLGLLSNKYNIFSSTEVVPALEYVLKPTDSSMEEMRKKG